MQLSKKILSKFKAVEGYFRDVEKIMSTMWRDTSFNRSYGFLQEDISKAHLLVLEAQLLRDEQTEEQIFRVKAIMESLERCWQVMSGTPKSCIGYLLQLNVEAKQRAKVKADYEGILKSLEQAKSHLIKFLAEMEPHLGNKDLQQMCKLIMQRRDFFPSFMNPWGASQKFSIQSGSHKVNLIARVENSSEIYNLIAPPPQSLKLAYIGKSRIGENEIKLIKFCAENDIKAVARHFLQFVGKSINMVISMFPWLITAESELIVLVTPKPSDWTDKAAAAYKFEKSNANRIFMNLHLATWINFFKEYLVSGEFSKEGNERLFHELTHSCDAHMHENKVRREGFARFVGRIGISLSNPHDVKHAIYLTERLTACLPGEFPYMYGNLLCDVLLLRLICNRAFIIRKYPQITEEIFREHFQILKPVFEKLAGEGINEESYHKPKVQEIILGENALQAVFELGVDTFKNVFRSYRISPSEIHNYLPNYCVLILITPDLNPIITHLFSKIRMMNAEQFIASVEHAANELGIQYNFRKAYYG